MATYVTNYKNELSPKVPQAPVAAIVTEMEA